MRKNLNILLFAIFCVGCVNIPVFAHDGNNIIHREISRTKEQSIKVKIIIGYGSINISRGEDKKIVSLDCDPRGETANDLIVTYQIVDGCGELVIKTKKEENIFTLSPRGPRYDIKLNGELPADVRLKLGAGSGHINLTDIKISYLGISAGTSSVKLFCDEPNKITAEKIDIESGVGSIIAKNLCNLNFKKIKFEGGIGSFNLDFGGVLGNNAEAFINIGLGSGKINIPSNIPSQINIYSSWLSSVKIDKAFHETKNKHYESENADKVENALQLKINSGIGGIKITSD